MVNKNNLATVDTLATDAAEASMDNQTVPLSRLHLAQKHRYLSTENSTYATK